jgi:ATPase
MKRHPVKRKPRQLKSETRISKGVLKLVPDTSVLVEGVLSQRIRNKSIKVEHILIHEASIAELESQANKGRETGHLGLDEVKRLRDLGKQFKFDVHFKGERPKDFEIKYAKAGEIDSLIRELASSEHATLVTADIVQSKVAESKGISVLLFRFLPEKSEKTRLEKYFDKTVMSVHLKEGCMPMAKRGLPGAWNFVSLAQKVLSRQDMQDMTREIIEEAKRRPDAFIEIERRGSTVVQLETFRVVIVRPPLSDGYEITATHPIRHMSLAEYRMPSSLVERIAIRAEGILIAGPPGHGKSTFAQALAEHYFSKNKVIKTIEAPRDLSLPAGITQYALSHGSAEELHDIILLSRPDFTFYDEIRNTEDFQLFTDLRLAGVGMVGVVHASRAIDAIQRFLGRIDLGLVPQVVDTVVFVKNGGIAQVYSLSLTVKIPSGMHDADLARPVIEVRDFSTGRLAYELYAYGEQTVVIPVQHVTEPVTLPFRIVTLRHNIELMLARELANQDVDLVSGDERYTVHTDQNGVVRLNKGSPTGKAVSKWFADNKSVEVHARKA